MIAWFTYWHVVAALVILAIALIYLAYRLEVWTEASFHRENWYLTGGAAPACLPLILASLCLTAALVMAAWKFVWWLL